MTDTELAIKMLGNAMKENESYAWSWQCNLAMMAIDAGAKHKDANIGAADLLHHVFGVDMKHRLKKEFGY